MYTLQRDANDEVIGVIRSAEGETPKHIDLDPGQQDFCDFLSWNSRQSPRLEPDRFGNLGDTDYFSDASALVEHCKWNHKMLVVEHESLATGPSRNILQRGFIGSREAEASSTATDETGLVASPASRIFATTELHKQLNEEIKDETTDARRISSWPITRTFVYVDVSDFSKLPTGHQALVINSIVAITHKQSAIHEDVWGNAPCDFEESFCIGDGYIFAFSDPIDATLFAAHFADLVDDLVAKRQVVEFHFRIGVHIGPVYSFWDMGRNGWNFIGDGINGGNRVLAAIGKDSDDNVYISSQARHAIIDETKTCDERRPDTLIKNMQNRGRRQDKHGNPWRVWEVNFKGLTHLHVSLIK